VFSIASSLQEETLDVVPISRLTPYPMEGSMNNQDHDRSTEGDELVKRLLEDFWLSQGKPFIIEFRSLLA
jgi:hypothetical protein